MSLSTPYITEKTSTSTTTATTTPKTVRNERILCSRRVVSAIRAFSPSLKCRLIVSIRSCLRLKSERFDWVQFRRAPGRINAKEEAHRGRNQDRGKHRRHGNRHRHRGCVFDENCKAPGNENADSAAHSRHHRTFHQELPQNIAAARAETLADANLPGSFCNARQH